ncbi:MAG: hypothetical protein PUJ87_03435 [Prevotellaceae bacterium]|nr:hypothetical protein [Prevotellaceae bacterium]
MPAAVIGAKIVEIKALTERKSQKRLDERKKCSNFAPLFGLTAGPWKSHRAMLSWNDKQYLI